MFALVANQRDQQAEWRPPPPRGAARGARGAPAARDPLPPARQAPPLVAEREVAAAWWWPAPGDWGWGEKGHLASCGWLAGPPPPGPAGVAPWAVPVRGLGGTGGGLRCG